MSPKPHVVLLVVVLLAREGLGQNPVAVMRELSDRNTDFGLKMYKEAIKDSDNVFFSPYSISVALAMLYRGSDSTTKQQMEQALGFNPNENVHETYKTIHDAMFKKGTNYTLREANKIFARKDYKILEDFQNAMTSHYNAPMEQLDFVKEPDASRKHINKWVEDQTEKTIRELLAEGVIDQSTVMVMVNAIFFRGFWKTQFNSNYTKNEEFTTGSGKTVSVDMMNIRDSKFNYFQNTNNNYQVLELPYNGDQVSMYVFLPDTLNGLAKLENALTATQISQDINNMRELSLTLKFPKFTITKDMNLNSMLSKLGLGVIFELNADLSRIDGTKNLQVSDVVHQAFVQVDEEGTKASAATAAVVSLKSSINKMLFQVNRPFLFLIREKSTGSTLFMGRVSNPSTTFMAKRSLLVSDDDGSGSGAFSQTPLMFVCLALLSLILTL